HHCALHSFPTRRSSDLVDFEIRLAHDPVRKDGLRPHRGDGLEYVFKVKAKGFDGLEAGTVHLDPHGRSHAALEHHDARVDGHEQIGKHTSELQSRENLV